MKVTGAAALFGLLGGVAVFALTAALSRSDIGGPGWSLKGNGALVVVFAATPALLAAGWVALAERAAGPAIAAGVVTLLLDVAVTFGPIILGPDDTLLLRLGFAFAVVPLVLAALAGIVIAQGRSRAPAAVAAVIAISLSLVVPGLEFVLVPLLVPVVLVVPVVARRWSRWLAANSLVLLVSVLIGEFGSQYLFGAR